MLQSTYSGGYIAVPHEIRFFWTGLTGCAGCTALYIPVNVHLFRNGYGMAIGQVRANEDVIMIPLEIITIVSNQIAQEFHPEQIILFGSYAYGEPHRDSDVDLLVVMSHGMDNVYQAIEILNRVAPPFPIDLLVRTPGEVKQRIALQDTFMQNIMDKGKVLYAATQR